MDKTENHIANLTIKLEGEESLRKYAIEFNRLSAESRRAASGLGDMSQASSTAAATFKSGVDGIRSWNDSLSRNKNGVSNWVRSMSDVDAVNRKFKESLLGNTGGLDNWVLALSKVDQANRNLLTTTDGVSNWVRAMGQVGSASTSASGSLDTIKSATNGWSTAVIGAEASTDKWVARMGSVDAANRRFNDSLLGSKGGIDNWIHAMGEASLATLNAQNVAKEWTTTIARVNAASEKFVTGADGIRSWSDSLSRSKSSVAGWVQAMSSVDAVNRQFQQGLLGNSNGVSNWVRAMSQTSSIKPQLPSLSASQPQTVPVSVNSNVFEKTDGISNWVRQMGQAGTAAQSTANTLKAAKASVDQWNTSMINSGGAANDWVSRMSSVDSSSKSFGARLRESAIAIGAWISSVGRANSVNINLFDKTDGVSNWVKAMGQAAQASTAAASNIDKTGKSSNNVASAFKGSGHTIRNISAQFSDFAVQVGSGQDAMRAFAQQAPQLLAAFAGPSAAIAGAAIAIAAAWPSLMELFGALSNTTRPLKDALDQLNTSLDNVGNTGKKFKLDQFIEEFNNADKATRQSMISLLEWQKEVAAIKAQQATKSTQKNIEEDLTQGLASKTLEFLKSPIGTDKFSRSIAAFGNDFAGAQNTLVDGLKISKEAATDLLTQLNFFKDLPETEMRRIILLFEKAGNTRFDDLVKNLYQVRDAQINVRRASEESNKVLKQAKTAVAKGTDIPTPQKGGDNNQDTNLFDKWYHSLLQVTQSSKLADQELAFLIQNFGALAEAGGNSKEVIELLNNEIIKLSQKSSSDNAFLSGLDAEINNAQLKAQQLKSQLEDIAKVRKNLSDTGQTGIVNRPSDFSPSVPTISADSSGLDSFKRKLSGVKDEIEGIQAVSSKGINFNTDQLNKSSAIMTRLMAELNLTKEQAAGVVGNLFHESAGLQTKSISGDGFGSVGLAQWTDRGKSLRKTALSAFAKGIGKSSTDFDAQVGFLITELRTSEKNALNALKSTNTVESATKAFQDKFERPDPQQAHTSRRIGAAQTALSSFSGSSKQISETIKVNVDNKGAISSLQETSVAATNLGDKFADQDKRVAEMFTLDKAIKGTVELDNNLNRLHVPKLELLKDSDRIEQIPAAIKTVQEEMNRLSASGQQGTPLFKAYTDQVIKWKQEFANATGVVLAPLEQIRQEAQKMGSLPSAISEIESSLGSMRAAGQENTTEFRALTDQLVKFKAQAADAAGITFVPFEQIAQDAKKMETVPIAIAQIEDRLRAMSAAGQEGTIEFQNLTETAIKMGQEFDNASGKLHLPFAEIAQQAKQLDQIPAAVDLIDKRLAEMQAAGLGATQAFRLLNEERDKLQSQLGPVEAFKVDLKKQHEELALTGDKIKAVQDAAVKGLITPESAQNTIINLREMNGEFDNTAQRFGDLMENDIKSTANSMVDALWGANVSFKDMLDNMLKDILKFLIQEQLTSWFKGLKSEGNGLGDMFSGLGDSLNSLGSQSSSLGSSLGSLFSSFGSSGGGGSFNGTGMLKSFGNSGGGGSWIDSLVSMGSSLFSSFAANGNVYSNGNLVPFARGGIVNNGNVIPFAMGGVVHTPTMFPMSNGRVGLMGESGSEAVMPLKRINGKLGVHAVIPSNNNASSMRGGDNNDNRSVNQTLNFYGHTDPQKAGQSVGQAARDALNILNTSKRYR